MKSKKDIKIFRILIPVLMIMAMVSGTNAQTVFQDIPDKIDAKADYLFYLHGHIIEIKGIRAVSEKYGVYEYEKILAALKKRGFIVISEARPGGTNTSQYAQKVVSQVERLLQAGVAPGNITVVGASKGALIAMFVSTILQNKEINFVFLAGCQEAILRFDIDFCGNILSIYDEKDELVGSCQKFFERSARINKHKEIKLTVGTGHGIVYKPLNEWIDPVVQWAKGEKSK